MSDSRVLYTGKHCCHPPERPYDRGLENGAIWRCSCGRYRRLSGGVWSRMTRWGIRRAQRQGRIEPEDGGA